MRSVTTEGTSEKNDATLQEAVPRVSIRQSKTIENREAREHSADREGMGASHASQCQDVSSERDVEDEWLSVPQDPERSLPSRGEQLHSQKQLPELDSRPEEQNNVEDGGSEAVVNRRRESASTASSGPDPEAEAAWGNLRTLHGQLVDKRVNKSDSLQAVRQQRKVVRALQISFNEEATLSSTGATSTNLQELQARLDHAQDKLESLEAACEKIEDEIINDEWDVEEIEKRFYVAFERLASVQKETGLRLLYTREEQSEHESASGNEPGLVSDIERIRADPSPQAKQYLSLLGDRDLLQERLDSLRSERADLEDLPTIERRYGVSIEEVSRNISVNFDIEHENLVARLTEIEDELDSLLQDLLDEPRETLPYAVASASDDEDISLDYYPGAQVLSPGELRSFQPLVGEIPRPFFDHSRITLNMSAFINDWLLYNLWDVEGEKRRYLDVLNGQFSQSSSKQLGARIWETWYQTDATLKIGSAQPTSLWSQGGSIKRNTDAS